MFNYLERFVREWLGNDWSRYLEFHLVEDVFVNESWEIACADQEPVKVNVEMLI